MSAIAISDSKLPVNYIFVDYENVGKDLDLSFIGAKTCHFTLLVGFQQTKLDANLVEKLMEHAASAQLIRLKSAGPNAVDFALAFYLGKAASDDPTAYFHIISKDKGFDPLVEHLKSRHIRAVRHNDFSTVTLSTPGKAAVIPEDPFSRALEHLRKSPNTRPKEKRALASHLLAMLGKSTTQAQVVAVIVKLVKEGHLIVGEKGSVTYQMDALGMPAMTKGGTSGPSVVLG